MGKQVLDRVRSIDRIRYEITPISAQPAVVGEPLLAIGFPAGTGELTAARGFAELQLLKSLLQAIARTIQMRLKLARAVVQFLMPRVSWLKLTVGASIDSQILASVLLNMAANRRQNYWQKWLNLVGEIPISLYLYFFSSHLGVSDEFVGFAI